MTTTLLVAGIFLVAAILIVPSFKKVGLGSVLGYLFAGICTGLILKFVSPVLGFKNPDHLFEVLSHFSEFGVVLMLFLIGLEIEPQQLWQMRAKIFGVGGLQLGLTATLIAGVAMLFGVPTLASITIGLVFALSSTAIIMQTLSEKGWRNTPGGKASFSVLLFQDIAVIPIMAILPILAHHSSHGSHERGPDLLGLLPAWAQTLATPVAVVAIFILARFAITPLFRFIAKAKLRELFTTAALATVIVISGIMGVIGLSAALGVFIAGVILSNSEYRHEIESDIEPFKGLLLGLFFMTVGASFNFKLFFSQPFLLFGLALGLMLLKGGVLFLTGKLSRMDLGQNALFSFALAQGGEFAFVLLAVAAGEGILGPVLIGQLKIIVAISMGLTPLAFLFYEKAILPKIPTEDQMQREFDTEFSEAPIIVAGFGRFGQLTLRLMASVGLKATVIDHDPDHIDLLKKWEWKVHYGDASRMDLLHAAGIEKAKMLIVAIDDPEKVLLIVKEVKRAYPELPILARARDRIVAYDLLDAGLDKTYRETKGTALDMGEDALCQLGMQAEQAKRVRQKFEYEEEKNFADLAIVRREQNDKFFDIARSSQKELETLLHKEFADVGKF